MKLSCTKDNLFQGLAVTSHLTGKNVNLPILSNTLIQADKRGIRLTTTNLEVAIVCTVRGKVDEEGELTIPSKLLFDYVNLLPNERVDLTREGDLLLLACEGNQTEIRGLPATEFPLVPPAVGDKTVDLPAEDFREALSEVLFAAAQSGSRAELSGISFRFAKDGQGKHLLTLAATDSYRLAERTLVLDGVSAGEPLDVIVPSRTLGEVVRVLGVFRDDPEAQQRLEVRLSDTQIVFRYGPVELTSRTIDGSYPDYRQIIPATFRTEATLDRESLLKAVKTASLFSRTGLFDVTLTFDPASGVTVSGNDTARGKNTAHAPAHLTGGLNTITVNSRYLIDGLNAIAEDEVTLGVNDGGSPCLVRPKEKKNYLYLVMPIKQ